VFSPGAAHVGPQNNPALNTTQRTAQLLSQQQRPPHAAPRLALPLHEGTPAPTAPCLRTTQSCPASMTPLPFQGRSNGAAQQQQQLAADDASRLPFGNLLAGRETPASAAAAAMPGSTPAPLASWQQLFEGVAPRSIAQPAVAAATVQGATMPSGIPGVLSCTPPSNQQQLQGASISSAHGNMAACGEAQLHLLQQQLQFLYYAANCKHCTFTEAHCDVGDQCRIGKQLLQHMDCCTDPQCSYPHCSSSKELLRGYEKCQVRSGSHTAAARAVATADRCTIMCTHIYVVATAAAWSCWLCLDNVAKQGTMQQWCAGCSAAAACS